MLEVFMRVQQRLSFKFFVGNALLVCTSIFKQISQLIQGLQIAKLVLFYGQYNWVSRLMVNLKYAKSF